MWCGLWRVREGLGVELNSKGGLVGLRKSVRWFTVVYTGQEMLKMAFDCS